MNCCRVLTVLLFLFAPSFGLPVVLAQSSDSLVEQLKSPNIDTRAKAAQEIGKAGDTSAVPALAAALTDPSEKVRREVVIALASFRSLEGLEALVTATRDSDPDVRLLAVQGVVGYYTGQSPRTGLTGFLKKGWGRAKSHFVTDNTRIDPGVQVQPKAISALDDAMMDARSIEAARESAKGLGILVAQAAIPDLVKAAHSSDEALAREALNALAKIKDRSSGPQLIDLLDSPYPDVKKDTAVTLGVLRTRDALPKLQAMFKNNPDTKTREKALEGLAYLGDPVSLPLFIEALWSVNKAIRTFAAEGLGRVGEAKTLPELEKAAATEQDAGARLAVQFAITALGKEDFLSALVKELGSKLRGDSAQTYLVELGQNLTFPPKLYPYLNSQDATVRRRLCTVLMFNADATSLEHLERLSHDPDGEVAAEALRAMRAVRARVPASAPGSPTGNSG